MPAEPWDTHMLLHRNSPHGTRSRCPVSEGRRASPPVPRDAPRRSHSHDPGSGTPVCHAAQRARTAGAHRNLPAVAGTHTVTKQVFNLTVSLGWVQEESRANSWSAYPTKPRSVSISLLFIALMELELSEAAVSRSTVNKVVINVQSCTSTGQGQLSKGQRETQLLTTSHRAGRAAIRQLQSFP